MSSSPSPSPSPSRPGSPVLPESRPLPDSDSEGSLSPPRDEPCIPPQPVGDDLGEIISDSEREEDSDDDSLEGFAYDHARILDDAQWVRWLTRRLELFFGAAEEEMWNTPVLTGLEPAELQTYQQDIQHIKKVFNKKNSNPMGIFMGEFPLENCRCFCVGSQTSSIMSCRTGFC